MVVGGSICTLLYLILNKVLQWELSLKCRSIFLKINVAFYLLPLPLIAAELKGKLEVWLEGMGMTFPVFRQGKITVYTPRNFWANLIIMDENNKIRYITGYHRVLPVVVAIFAVFCVLLAGWMIAYLAVCRNYKKDIIYMDSERYIKKLETGRKKIRIGLSPFISSPVTIGIIKPVILLPVNDERYAASEGVIHHELKHIVNKDGLFRFLTFVIVAMEWYNPLAYYLVRENMAVSEMLCDEAAVKGMSKGEMVNYMECIIAAANKNQNEKLVTATLGTSKSLTEERMKRIMGKNSKKLWKKGMAVGIMVSCFLISSIPALAYKEPPIWYVEEGIMQWDEAKSMVVFVEDGYDTMLGEEWKYPDWNVDFSQGDQLFIDENGGVYPVKDSELKGNDQIKASCNHNYIAGDYHVHETNDSGGCTVITYNAKRCTKCGITKDTTEIASATYKACPH
mgnify:FL=1